MPGVRRAVCPVDVGCVYRSSFRQDEEDEMSEVREEGVSEEGVDAGVKCRPAVTQKLPRMSTESKGSGVKARSLF